MVNSVPGKECNEAYEVLSDPQKKARYDQFGFAGVDPNYGAEAKKRIKKVEAGKKLAKKTAKKAAKDTAKAVAKETAKETAKTTAKVATKTATKAAATAAGTAVAPGVGTAIGIAAGYAAGVSIEVKDEKMTNRSRKIKFFLDKMKAQENQTDSVAKLVKDLIVRKAITWVKAAAPITRWVKLQRSIIFRLP